MQHILETRPSQTGLSLPIKGNREDLSVEHPHQLHPHAFHSSGQLRDSLNLLCEASSKRGTASVFSGAAGSPAAMAHPTYEPAAEGDQASCAGSGAHRRAANGSQPTRPARQPTHAHGRPDREEPSNGELRKPASRSRGETKPRQRREGKVCEWRELL